MATNRVQQAPQMSECFLCGAQGLVSVPYINLKLVGFIRRCAYLAPASLIKALGRFIPRIKRRYQSVHANRTHFGTRVVFWCADCQTGLCFPPIADGELSTYYHEFYWSNRDRADGQHLSEGAEPNDVQKELTADRFRWIGPALLQSGTFIDFGAGDCAAGYAISQMLPHCQVQIIDPAERAETLAARYGMKYSPTLDAADACDFLYSAHSIEHVSDLMDTFRKISEKVRLGGAVFFETPNIANPEILTRLIHTPHTYMLSAATFSKIEQFFPLKVIRWETAGPLWRKNTPAFTTAERTDVRVLMRRTADN